MRKTVLSLTSVAVALLLACAVGLLGVENPAQAAFPGENGEIVFWSDRSAGPGLYTITAAGGTATKIPGTSGGDNHAVWSPDGSRIVFVSGGNTTNTEISVMNADGSGRRQLTNTDSIAEQEPTWSPDGSQIAFAADNSDTDETTDLEIWVMNTDGSGLTQLTNTDNGVRDTQPAWSPLGNRIAFLSEGRTDDTNSNIYVMDTDPATNDATNLTPNNTTINPVYQWNDEEPSWSPDGTQITYSTGVDVWKMNADGTSKANLTLRTGGGRQPAWSPDGDSIVYVRSDGTDRNIYVMDTDHTTDDKKPVDTTLRKDEKPDWQPNTAPVITSLRPAHDSTITDRTPRIQAKVVDKQTNLVERDITLTVDDQRISRRDFSYDSGTDRLEYTPPSNLPYGWHVVTLVARDSVGLRTTAEWRFRIVRP